MIFKCVIYPIDGFMQQMTTKDGKTLDLWYFNIKDDDAYAVKLAQIRVEKSVYDQISPNGFGKEYNVLGRWDWKRTDFSILPAKTVIKEILEDKPKNEKK